MATFLELTNEVIGRVNDVLLTSTTFASATGFQAEAKQYVLDAVRRINQDEFNWPFNYAAGSQLLVADTGTYSLPANYKVIDWDSFAINKDDSLTVNKRKLRPLDYHEYLYKFQERDGNLTTGGGGVPDYVYRTPDDKFGLTTLPDKAYTVTYNYYTSPTELSAHGDVCSIPDRWKHVIMQAAMVDVYMFRSNEQAAGIANQKFKDSIQSMRTILGNTYIEAWDTRTRDAL